MNELYLVFAICALYSGVVAYSLGLTAYERIKIKIDK